MERSSIFHNSQHFYPHQWRPRQQGMYYERSPRLDYYKRNDLHNHSSDHWCETCDRGFQNIGMLEKHKQQHQKCNIDGCQFVAHPKVITKHIQMQHSSGLFKKIAKLNNPEEIKKWIEERKRKYPTKDNINQKAAELKEKIMRGEKMGLKYEKSNHSGEDLKRKRSSNYENNNRGTKMRRNNTHGTNINIKNSSPNKFVNKNLSTKKDDKVLSILDSIKKIKPFAGIRDLVTKTHLEDYTETESCNYLIDDENEVQKTFEDKPKVCGALSSLMCDYGSSEDEPECALQSHKDILPSAIEKNVNKRTDNRTNIDYTLQTSTNSNEIINECKQSDDESGPEETKFVKKTDISDENISLSPRLENNNAKNLRRMHNSNRIMNRKPKLPSTLLQKLLHKEIQHERNIILQCVRYVIKNNYFDNSQTKQTFYDK